MPAYLYRCSEGHEFEIRMTYDEFDMLRDNPEIKNKLICKRVIYSYGDVDSDEPNLAYCLGPSDIQIQSTPFKINLLEE